MHRRGAAVAVFLLFASFATAGQPPGTIELRSSYGVPQQVLPDVNTLADIKVVAAFEKQFPHIKPVPGQLFYNMEAMPMLVAGDIAPDVFDVNFRQSDTYIRNKFLYPLEKYIEKSAGTDIPNGHLMDLEQYIAAIAKAPGYHREIENRVPRQCWEVMRRECPYGQECPYLKQRGLAQAAKHYHVWTYPSEQLVIALFYRKDFFKEAGLPDRAPETMEELLQWARKLHNPRQNRYGVWLNIALSWSTMSFLYSSGGRMVQQDANGNWVCCYDSPQAVDAWYYLARLLGEPFKNDVGTFDSPALVCQYNDWGDAQYAMFFDYLDSRFFGRFDPAQWSFGPVPKGFSGLRGSEFNSKMLGLFVGIEDDVPRRDAAWEFIRFCDSPEARKIRTDVFIQNGLGHYVRPPLLRETGHSEFLRQIPKGWEEAFQVAVNEGIPEPYGKNCQMVYPYVDQGIGQMRIDQAVKDALVRHDAKAAKARITTIFQNNVDQTNRKMLNLVPPKEKTFRTGCASVVAVIVFLIFTLLFRKVFRTFAAASDPLSLRQGRWQFGRYKYAYMMLLPAVGSIALWAYYPLVKGATIAFQDYNVRGFTTWVGAANFAEVLFDPEFWYSMWVSFKYAAMFLALGFAAPIILAILLTEVPRGKILFRTVYYLPAVLTGVLVMFLWRSFYEPYGLLNGVINLFVGALNLIPSVHIEEVHKAWLQSPGFALFFCLVPVIWAGVGPGCLIYLAALKTIPEDLYEASDIDGASTLQKVFAITLPSIRSLILINFIGVMVAVVKGGSEFNLAMTNGGPYAPYGETEVVGLHIYRQAFFFLRFGTASAMGWILGSFLIGFTVFQLQRLSKMDFRTAARPGA